MTTPQSDLARFTELHHAAREVVDETATTLRRSLRSGMALVLVGWVVSFLVALYFTLLLLLPRAKLLLAQALTQLPVLGEVLAEWDSLLILPLFLGWVWLLTQPAQWLRPRDEATHYLTLVCQMFLILPAWIVLALAGLGMGLGEAYSPAAALRDYFLLVGLHGLMGGLAGVATFCYSGLWPEMALFLLRPFLPSFHLAAPSEEEMVGTALARVATQMDKWEVDSLIRLQAIAEQRLSGMDSKVQAVAGTLAVVGLLSISTLLIPEAILQTGIEEGGARMRDVFSLAPVDGGSARLNPLQCLIVPLLGIVLVGWHHLTDAYKTLKSLEIVVQLCILAQARPRPAPPPPSRWQRFRDWMRL